VSSCVRVFRMMTYSIGSSGIIAWLVTASALNGGVLNVDTTGQDYPMYVCR
jgi:hypothetical protein